MMLHCSRLWLLLLTCADAPDAECHPLHEGGNGKKLGLCLCIATITQEAARSKLIIGNVVFFSHCN